MSDGETRLHDVAVQLWGAAVVAVASEDAPVVSEHLFVHLEAGLRRWIGAEGYASLLSRSLSEVLPMHPALSTIPNLLVDELELPAHTRADSPAQRDAILALLTAMMRTLGRIIGENLAVRLIAQSATPSPRGAAGDMNSDTSS